MTNSLQRFEGIVGGYSYLIYHAFRENPPSPFRFACALSNFWKFLRNPASSERDELLANVSRGTQASKENSRFVSRPITWEFILFWNGALIGR
jgi:hypothetical protein